MKEPDYKAYWDALSHVSVLSNRPDIQDAFRREYREEILGNLSWLYKLGLVWGATSLHPDPPDACELCGTGCADCQVMVDGITAAGEWAHMCPKCFLESGQGVGPGTGQLYLNVGNGNWRLVAGGDQGAPDVDDE